MLVSGTNGINVSAGANDVVFLKGLDFEGIGTGLVGIQFNTGAALHVDNCVIRGFQAGTAVGINFTPSGGQQQADRSQQLHQRERDLTHDRRRNLH